MGLLQKAVQTYDFLEKNGWVGKYEEGKMVLPPISHVVTSAAIQITLDEDGTFVSASEFAKDAQKIIIPVTESSAGRTSGVCAHPLCDQLGYLVPYNKDKYQAYINQLEKWALSKHTHPKLIPILHYVKTGTILSDLNQSGLVELDAEGHAKKEKLLVCWSVLEDDPSKPEQCWRDVTLFQAFIDYYNEISADDETGFCMVTGQHTRPAIQHQKGIVPTHGNAKLISSNDTKWFTYLGRFTDASQAVEIGYEASQKAHNALRWLIVNQGATAVYGGRTFICWNPNGKKLPGLMLPFLDHQHTEVAYEPSDYGRALQKALAGYQEELSSQAERSVTSEEVVIAAFDAATSGRLALTYYNELLGSDFLQRLHDWDAHCCWYNGRFGIQSPSLWQIVNCAFGTQQGNYLKTDDRVMRQQMQRLVECRVNRAKIPADILRALVNRASMPMAYERSIWLTIVFVACAVLNKYEYERGEERQMALEDHLKDRSYLFGRLLAVYEKIEKDTYNEETQRTTNAIRQMSSFKQKPYSMSDIIYEKIRVPYLEKLPFGLQNFYHKELEHICALLDDLGLSPEELNKPLGASFLFGYNLQMEKMYEPKVKTEGEKDE